MRLTRDALLSGCCVSPVLMSEGQQNPWGTLWHAGMGTVESALQLLTAESAFLQVRCRATQGIPELA